MRTPARVRIGIALIALALIVLASICRGPTGWLSPGEAMHGVLAMCGFGEAGEGNHEGVGFDGFQAAVGAALLAVVAHRVLGDRALAVTADSESLSAAQRALALDVAARFGFAIEPGTLHAIQALAENIRNYLYEGQQVVVQHEDPQSRVAPELLLDPRQFVGLGQIHGVQALYAVADVEHRPFGGGDHLDRLSAWPGRCQE